MTIPLARGVWSLELQPELGGSVAAFRRGGVDVFRPTPAGADHPLMTGCFPLVPYANRIAHGRFGFDGQDFAVPRNFLDDAHPLHGIGWLVPWQVAASADDCATLTHHHHANDAWPWAYAATQVFSLDEDGLTLTLSVTSRDSAAFPMSLGLHPYFAAPAGTRLRFDAEAVWLSDAGLLPTEQAPAGQLADWHAGDEVLRSTLIDHCYAGWSGSATIVRQDGTLRLSGDGTRFLHLYMPPGADFFCAEPVTAMPDAVNRGAAAVLHPGETHTITMRVTQA